MDEKRDSVTELDKLRRSSQMMHEKRTVGPIGPSMAEADQSKLMLEPVLSLFDIH